MYIKYQQKDLLDNSFARLFDNNNQLLLKINFHKIKIYENREDDLNDPVVPYSLTTEYNGALCWSNSIDLKSLKTTYFEMTSNLVGLTPDWKMIFVSAQYDEVYNEFLNLFNLYASSKSGILVLPNDEAVELCKNETRFYERFVVNEKWNKILIGIKEVDLPLYNTSWINKSKGIK
jgi:hypothetical protein